MHRSVVTAAQRARIQEVIRASIDALTHAQALIETDADAAVEHLGGLFEDVAHDQRQIVQLARRIRARLKRLATRALSRKST